MGSESQHRGHPLPEPSQQFPVRTPLSVAELLSSRPPASDPVYHRTGDTVPLPRVERPVSRSTPPAPPALSAPVNAPTATERPSWNAVNHASPQVSRTTTKLPPIAVHDNNQSRQSLSQPAVPSFYSASTSQASRSPQDAPRSLTPINSHRQDSAIFQHRTETAKEAQALGPLSDVVANSSLQSPDDSQRSISPRSNSYPTTPSSPQPSHQGQSRSGMQAQSRGNSKHRPSSNHKSPASGDNDHSTISNTRQQRYNVRFNQIYTSDNMPPSQKPRNDPLAATPVSTEATEPQPKTPDRPVTPTAMPSMVPGLPSLDEQSQTQQRADDSSVERCKYCNEIWRRPLPDLDQYQSQGEDVPAQTTHDIARNSMNLIARLRNIGTQADLAYDRWCYKHRFCVPPPEGMRPPSPPVTEPQGDLHSTSAHGPRRDSRITDMSVNNKRKSDQPHDNDRQINSKSRKVTFKT